MDGPAIRQGDTEQPQCAGRGWRIVAGAELEHVGPLLGGHDAAVGLAQRVGTIANDAMHADIYCTEPLAQHRF
ncbi:MAG TPA: hypothetical protein VI542_27700, partial [Candidatus Tectomicrobia bacterium]